jgi:enolase
MVNIVSGGAHAAGAIAIQDVLAIPSSAHTVEDAIENVWRVRKGTREIIDELGFPTALVADEGGLAAGFASSEDAIKAVVDGVLRAGLAPMAEISLALDVAANEFLGERGKYQFEGETLSERDLVEIISRWVSTLPIASVEDPLAEDADWATLARLLRTVQVVGDDRYATSVDRLEAGISRQEANSVLIKPNQAGSLWGAVRAIQVARDAGWGTIVSARSGDTEEQWLVDLAVGSGAGQIKVGSTMRSERTAKWNRMLELSAMENLPYAGNEK